MSGSWFHRCLRVRRIVLRNDRLTELRTLATSLGKDVDRLSAVLLFGSSLEIAAEDQGDVDLFLVLGGEFSAEITSEVASYFPGWKRKLASLGAALEHPAMLVFAESPLVVSPLLLATVLRQHLVLYSKNTWPDIQKLLKSHLATLDLRESSKVAYRKHVQAVIFDVQYLIAGVGSKEFPDYVKFHLLTALRARHFVETGDVLVSPKALVERFSTLFPESFGVFLHESVQSVALENPEQILRCIECLSLADRHFVSSPE